MVLSRHIKLRSQYCVVIGGIHPWRKTENPNFFFSDDFFKVRCKIISSYLSHFTCTVRARRLWTRLTFTIVKGIDFQNIIFGKSISLSQGLAWVGDGLYCWFTVHGERIFPIMHYTLEIVRSLECIDLSVTVLVEVVLHSWILNELELVYNYISRRTSRKIRAKMGCVRHINRDGVGVRKSSRTG